MGGGSKKKGGKKQQQQAGSSSTAAQRSSSAGAAAADQALSWTAFAAGAVSLRSDSAAALLKGGQVQDVTSTAVTFLQQQEVKEQNVLRQQRLHLQLLQQIRQRQQQQEGQQQQQQQLPEQQQQQQQQQQQLPEQQQQQQQQQQLQGQQRQQLLLEQEIQQQQKESEGSRVAPQSMAQYAALVISLLQPTLQKLFAARKRARDWKKPELSSRVCCALAAIEVALDLLLRIPGAYDSHEVTAVIEELSRAGLLQQTASAQGEVAQLLHALLQQQQRGQLPAEAALQLQELQQLAYELLRCWLPLRELVMWSDEFSASRQVPAGAVATAGFLLDAVELAAVLAQSLHADSPTQRFDIVTKLTHRTFLNLFPTWPDNSPSAAAAHEALFGSPAYLQLLLILLLLHSNALVENGVRRQPLSSTEHAWELLTSGQPLPQQQQQQQQQEPSLQQQQMQQQLQDAVRQLWQQLGMVPAALPAFTAKGLSGFDGFSTSSPFSPVYLTPATVDPLPWFDSTDSEVYRSSVQAFHLATQGVQQCLHQLGWLRGGRALGQAKSVPSSDQLSRQHLQLLQAAVWLLPQLLLQTALLYGCGHGKVVEAAADTAAAAAVAWQVPGLHTAASAAVSAAASAAIAAAAGGSCRTGPAAAAAAARPAVMQPLSCWMQRLLDCVLALLHQQLLQAPGGLLRAAAAAGVNLQYGIVINCDCQRVPAKASRNQQFAADSGLASSCVPVACRDVDAVASLLFLLRRLAELQPCPDDADGYRQVWRSKAPAVLLLLEAVSRGILPHHLHCSAGHTGLTFPDQDLAGTSSSGSGTSSGSGSSSRETQPVAGVHVNSSAAEELLEQLARCFEGDSLSLYGVVVGLNQQDQQQDQQQQQPQVWSLMASLLKAYRVRVPTASSAVVIGTIAWAACQACGTAHSPVFDSRQDGQDPWMVQAAWHAALAPWFVLLGRCLLTSAHILETWAAGMSCRDAQVPVEQLQSACNVLKTVSGVRGLLAGLLEKWAIINSSFSSQQLSALPAAQVAAAVAAAAAAFPVCIDWPPALLDRILLLRIQGPLQLQAGTAQMLWGAAMDRIVHLRHQQEAEGQGSGVSDSDSGSDSHAEDQDDDAAALSIDERMSRYLVRVMRLFARSRQESVILQTACLNWPELCAEMRAVGLVVCAQLPVPWCCNNPACTVLTGASELQLVGGKGCVCGGCRVARYCSRSCQAAHREQHKPVCEQLVATAAAAATAGALAAVPEPAAGAAAGTAAEP